MIDSRTLTPLCSLFATAVLVVAQALAQPPVPRPARAPRIPMESWDLIDAVPPAAPMAPMSLMSPMPAMPPMPPMPPLRMDFDFEYQDRIHEYQDRIHERMELAFAPQVRVLRHGLGPSRSIPLPRVGRTGDCVTASE